MQVPNLKESMTKKGVEFACERLIFEVCQPQQAKKALDESVRLIGPNDENSSLFSKRPLPGARRTHSPPIAPGETFTYEFDLRQSGTCLYDSHMRATAHDGSGRASLWIGSGPRHAATNIPCAQVVGEVGLIQEREAELIRANADTLDCPIPPFVGSTKN